MVGVQAWRRRGMASVMDEEQGHGRRGGWHGAVDSMGWCSGGAGGGVGAGLK